MVNLTDDIKFGLSFTPGSVKWSWGSQSGYGFIQRQTIQTDSGSITNEEILNVATEDITPRPDPQIRNIMVDGKQYKVVNVFVDGDGLESVIVLSQC